MKSNSKGLNQIGIVGLGLIGGSIGLDLQAQGYKVCGLVNRELTVKKAQSRNLAQVIDTDPKILANCSIIILALPLSEILNPSRELLNHLPINAVITDVGSVKVPVIKTWTNLHPQFVASHPMAGTHKSGVEAGQHNLFRNRPWVATPTRSTNSEAIEMVKKLAQALGSKWIIADPYNHDKAVALISHLPVIVSAALLNTATEDNDNLWYLELARKLASSGFSDTTRVGGGNPKLGVDMASNNSHSILELLDLYQVSLENLKEMIASKKWEELNNVLDKAAKTRSQFINN
ncbi:MULTISPECIES: prephenate/arogenate dehydrogenase [Prochlorococcus]|uniref:prephenate/arogenate dehydrogenase n=1 Tax=Prochlorococcus TaxID=1218 RepID=UPI000533A6B7|nr:MULTISPECIES: prephenate/arogenate dehydrogenase [Prochlorococcus]KGG13588.1 Arogenate dehydrogenase [Prochlorococcus sp. MIT 0601]